jgi:hypothetical protein
MAVEGPVENWLDVGVHSSIILTNKMAKPLLDFGFGILDLVFGNWDFGLQRRGRNPTGRAIGPRRGHHETARPAKMIGNSRQ